MNQSLRKAAILFRCYGVLVALEDSRQRFRSWRPQRDSNPVIAAKGTFWAEILRYNLPSILWHHVPVEVVRWLGQLPRL